MLSKSILRMLLKKALFNDQIKAMRIADDELSPHIKSDMSKTLQHCQQVSKSNKTLLTRCIEVCGFNFFSLPCHLSDDQNDRLRFNLEWLLKLRSFLRLKFRIIQLIY